ncbi:Manganese-dependent 2,3-dihydroxybiphenyl 1,2-dioxygenase [Pigmentiphaga humi]|uniref:Manganese-dependent 2,3-dihydroxybiphenyl 1,2-dioxygenase n=1 Tax=Pigmentiphaga humi TaxID=2478468 RepID=A0A3P4AZH9_9BURK|nr:VOC family protein [Pigmentiphaga humi]VCU68971.1 Manganese-dependent 2,3-dihydroxybiphenyl 1,2-dioxygenase [Pigmentiphaga humi]
MASSTIQGLRSVALDVPDLDKAEAFYTQIWHLAVAAREPNAVYFRGTGPDHHLLALHRGPRTAIRHVTLRARSEQALHTIAHACAEAGGSVADPVGPARDPAGGLALRIRDGDGRLIEIVDGDARHADVGEHPDRPSRLAHAVLNSDDVPATQRFFERALDFRLSDRTRIMAFMNCNSDHHTIALGDTDNNALNHIAFVMPDVESVMRGGGRMKDAGYGIEWGPGRHGPGDNAFNYFIGPSGEVIEYTAGVEQIDDSYLAGGPDDWKWPPGRLDQWGISAPPSARLKAAQSSVFFAAGSAA